MCVCARRTSLLALVVAGIALTLAAADVPALPALRCPNDATENQCKELNSTDTFRDFRVKLPFSKKNDYSSGFLTFSYEGGNSLKLKCFYTLNLDSSRKYLPAFTSALHVGNVVVLGCPPAHYAAVFATLNVTLTSPLNLKLTYMYGTLTSAHLADLPHFRHLKLEDGALLRSLPASLDALTVVDTHLFDYTILETLPRTLTELRLERVNITRVPAAVLNLPELRSLYVSNEKDWTLVTVESSNTTRLRQLYVSGADASLIAEWAPPALEEVTLIHWRAERPKPLTACDNLVKLRVEKTEICELPAGWVARCPRLEELHITNIYVTELPARLLENATLLTSLSIDCANHLSSLPAQLFADTPNLTHLSLAANTIFKLPAQLFANIPHLTHLDMGSNELRQLPSSMLTLPLVSLNLGQNDFEPSVVAEIAASFPELRNLTLDWSPKFLELCTVNDDNVPGKSPLVSLSKLERLELQYTGISVICSDWSEDMVNLTYLDLTHTSLDNLTYKDLQFKRRVPAVVKLYGKVYFTAEDYDRAAAAAAVAPPSRFVTIILASEYLDCHQYWLAKALNDELLPLDDVVVALSKLSLRSVRTELLLCTKQEMCGTVPKGCDCGMAGGRLLRVVCDGVNLDHVPRLQLLYLDDEALDLVLPNNSITKLDVDDLPPHLRVLDLRNNSISYITEATARALVSGTKRRVLLAGNRLECSCRATPALRVLRDHAAALVGYDALRCEDGRTLEVAIDACSTLIVTAKLGRIVRLEIEKKSR